MSEHSLIRSAKTVETPGTPLGTRYHAEVTTAMVEDWE